MNKEAVLRYLQNFFADIDVFDDLPPELIALIAGSGIEQSFFRILSLRITMLLNLGIHAVKHKEFESIGDGLFSMHLTGTGFNIRILYSFLSNHRPVLLLAFYERGGKRKTDYTPYIQPAIARLNKMKEEM